MGVNWPPSRVAAHNRVCTPCETLRVGAWAAANRVKRRVSSRRYREANRDKERARGRIRARRLAETNARPRVYVVVNPSWPDHVKIGLTTKNPTSRLVAFNVSDPHKAFSYAALVEVEDPRQAEKMVHETLEHFRVRADGEWFKMSTDVAVRLVESLRNRSSSRDG